MGPFRLTDFSPCYGFYLPFSCIPGTSHGKSDHVKITFLVLDIFVFCKYSPSLFWDAMKLLGGTQAALSLGLIFLTPALRPCWYPYQCHVPVWQLRVSIGHCYFWSFWVVPSQSRARANRFSAGHCRETFFRAPELCVPSSSVLCPVGSRPRGFPGLHSRDAGGWQS